MKRISRNFHRLLLLSLVLLIPFLLGTAEILRTNIPTGTNAMQVLPSARRAWVIIRAPDTNLVTVYLSLDGSTNVTTDSGEYPGVPLIPGGVLVWSGVEEGADANDQPVYAIHGSTTNQALILQYR